MWHERHLDEESGEEVLAAFAPVPDSSWGVLAKVPVAQALSAIESLKWQALGLGLALAAALLFVASVAARRLARPLTHLAEAAERTAEGTLGEVITPQGPREVAELTVAFNQMGAALKESHERLEERIAQRTEELRRSRAFLQLLLDSIEQRVIVVDRDFEIVTTNREARRMHGDNLEGAKLFDVLAMDSGRTSRHPAVRTLSTGTRAVGERRERVGADYEIVRTETFPVHTEDGAVEAIVCLGHVVTDERRLQAQMVHQEKMASFGMLAAGVAHDIGNPLAAIQSQLRVSREQSDPAQTKETLEIVEREVTRISRLLRDLVSFARRRKDDEVLLDLNTVVGDVVRLLVHDPRARNTRVEVKASAGIPPVFAKEDGIVQILLNLGINALDSMPEGGTLTFETTGEGQGVVVRVRDEGPGVPKDARETVFEPFFTTKPRGRGTGLGLFVSKGIAEGLGGELTLEQTGASGTVFKLQLPAEAARKAEVRR
jgi:signal transduction histidine kinase